MKRHFDHTLPCDVPVDPSVARLRYNRWAEVGLCVFLAALGVGLGCALWVLVSLLTRGGAQ